jgi:eukaryotic-like serine/threonine-protein kinase
MALNSGTRIGPYEVFAQIGVGGMGEVYRATDSNLGRQVAIKVLPAAFAQDAERLARFDREARTLALLNHPNIAHVYGLERGAGQIALVMELVEGPTLADRLANGAMPLDEVLPIARQIAEGLEAAHEQGIIHRDLKPANIKVRDDGTVKILDFGLARAVDPVSSMSSSVSAATITSPAAFDVGSGRPEHGGGAMTQMGVILGTAAYMSPEQARGKPLDRRTDIWAFGCVLYEMLTGRRAFAGEDVTEVLARVIEREVDFTAVPATVPPSITRLLRRCLEKDRKQRLTDIGVARLDIDEVKTIAADEHAKPLPAPAPPSSSLRERLLWAAAVVVAAAMAAAVTYGRRPAPEAPAGVTFEVPVTSMRWGNDLAISANGQRIAYAAAAPDGRRGLWVRPLDAVQATLLPGTETSGTESMTPAWSPDGRFLVFAADGSLKKVDVAGGAPQVLTALGGQLGGATWNRDNVIVFASNDHGLRRINASGGAVTPVSERDESLDELFHDAPAFLPDGRHFLYLAWSQSRPTSRAVYVGSLDSTSRTRLMDAESNAAYAQGHLLFLRGDSLMAQPFDPDRLQLSGEAIPVARGVAKVGGELGAFDVAQNGTLIYRVPNAQALHRQLVWLDRSGKSFPASQATFETGSFRLSPDGQRIAFTEGTPNDVWIYDLVRNVRTRLTTDPADDHQAIWSPDGTRVLFDSHRAGNNGNGMLFEKPANGATPEQSLLPPEKGHDASPRDWSPDGRAIVYARSGGDNPWNLWVLPMEGDRKPFAYRSGKFLENEAAISPNGQWLAFTSSEPGQDEVIVQSFPDPSRGRWQISTDGGVAPRWRRDGRELFYLDPKGRIVVASVMTDKAFSVQSTTPLVQTPLPLPLTQGGGPSQYDVSPDGQRFLLLVPIGSATPAPITVRLNWLTSLARP